MLMGTGCFGFREKSVTASAFLALREARCD